MSSSRGALDLLSSYGDDSSEDDVPGPRVSTKRTFKESDDEDVNRKFVKNDAYSFRLPVPNIFSESTRNEYTDDPEVHSGRLRSFKHERGNWATYLYIACSAEHSVDDICKDLVTAVKSLELFPVEHQHISLTRTVILRHHWISSFVDSVRSKISFVRKFIIVFGSLKVYCNEERTRTFVGLEIKTGYDSLISIVSMLDSCLNEFNLQEFYKNPSFHMSIMWCVGDKEAELNVLLPDLNELYLQSMHNVAEEHLYMCVDHIQCKTGNKVFSFQFL